MAGCSAAEDGATLRVAPSSAPPAASAVPRLEAAPAGAATGGAETAPPVAAPAAPFTDTSTRSLRPYSSLASSPIDPRLSLR